MHYTVLTVIASAAVVAATPIRRAAFNPLDYPHCPPAIIALLPGCIDSPSDTCFANAPELTSECLEEIKKVHPGLRGLPSAAGAAAPAPAVAAPPHRRAAFDASQFPDCTDAILALLPGCIDSPSDTCFANIPQFPPKCLEEIQKVHPGLRGLPSAATAAAADAAPPHRRAAFDASQFPDCTDAILALLPGCIDSPSDTCFANIPQFPPKCLEEIKKVHPGLRGLPSAATAAAPAPAVAAPPHRRAAFDASQFPDCTDAIIALLPGCIDSPADTCFASIPQFPPKCLEEIKKVHPTLRGLPSTATTTPPAVAAAPPAAAAAPPAAAGAAPPHRRANFDASQFPDCPDAILALLPGCINSPSDNCFASISQFPPKCLEEIKKVHPGLRGLPSGN